MDDRGRGGGLVVSVLAFYSDYPSSNPTGYLNFRYKKMKMNEKEAGVAPPPPTKKLSILPSKAKGSRRET